MPLARIIDQHVRSSVSSSRRQAATAICTASMRFVATVTHARFDEKKARREDLWRRIWQTGNRLDSLIRSPDLQRDPACQVRRPKGFVHLGDHARTACLRHRAGQIRVKAFDLAISRWEHLALWSDDPARLRPISSKLLDLRSRGPSSGTISRVCDDVHTKPKEACSLDRQPD